MLSMTAFRPGLPSSGLSTESRKDRQLTSTWALLARWVSQLGVASLPFLSRHIMSKSRICKASSASLRAYVTMCQSYHKVIAAICCGLSSGGSPSPHGYKTHFDKQHQPGFVLAPGNVHSPTAIPYSVHKLLSLKRQAYAVDQV